jgi:hypothetical protein
MTKKWIICMQCKYNTECKMGQIRTDSVEKESLISSDAGCYNYEEYYDFGNIQLKLFKPGRKLLEA